MGAYEPGATPSAEEAAFGLVKLNRLLDAWAARRSLIYTSQFLSFTLTPSLSPHTIGPSGATFTTLGSRPTKIDAASIILNTSTPYVNTPLNIRDSDWWAAQQVQTLTSNLPTDLYYEPAFPNGKLYFWPVGTVAYGVQLELWTQLQNNLTLFDNLVMPPGYQDAITYSLAVSLLPAGEKAINPALVQLAQRALALIQGNNFPALSLPTQDAGMPRTGERSGARADFNWLTGKVG